MQTKTIKHAQRSKKSTVFGQVDSYLARELKANPDVQGAALEFALLHLRYDDEGPDAEKLEGGCAAIHDRCCASLGVIEEYEGDLHEAVLNVVIDLAFKVKGAVLKSLGNPRLAEVNLRSFLRSN